MAGIRQGAPMRILRLTVDRLRNLAPVDLRPAPGLNLVIGDNGAGKTSLLEAIHVLAFGRSFRGRVRDGLIRTGSEALAVFVELEELDGAGSGPSRVRRIGLRHAGGQWEGRVDGQPVDQLGLLCSRLAALTFEPGSHALVVGGGEPRRRFLDWGLFHVEPGDSGGFLTVWRRYARALKQRNALLRQLARGAELDVWDRELALAGEALDRRRSDYLERLQPRLAEASGELAPALGAAVFAYQPGWRRDELPLVDALLLARERDRQAGHTSVGPHRADWRIQHANRPEGEALSRGQAKLTALACLLAQGADYAMERGAWPVILLDDLASELDDAHQRRLLERLRSSGAQVFITGTVVPSSLADGDIPVRRFHVEQGQVEPNQV